MERGLVEDDSSSKTKERADKIAPSHRLEVSPACIGGHDYLMLIQYLSFPARFEGNSFSSAFCRCELLLFPFDPERRFYWTSERKFRTYLMLLSLFFAWNYRPPLYASSQAREPRKRMKPTLGNITFMATATLLQGDNSFARWCDIILFDYARALGGTSNHSVFGSPDASGWFGKLKANDQIPTLCRFPFHPFADHLRHVYFGCPTCARDCVMTTK